MLPGFRGSPCPSKKGLVYFEPPRSGSHELITAGLHNQIFSSEWDFDLHKDGGIFLGREDAGKLERLIISLLVLLNFYIDTAPFSYRRCSQIISSY